jgi:hypothetical protein
MNQQLTNLKKHYADTRAEMADYLTTKEAAEASLAAAQELLASTQAKVSAAHAALGRAVITDKGEEAARNAFEEARLEMERAQFKFSAVQTIVDESNTRAGEARYSNLQQNSRHTADRIRELVIAEELEGCNEKYLAPLLRAWSFECGPGNGHGFSQWLSRRFENFTIRPELMKQLKEAVHADYGV